MKRSLNETRSFRNIMIGAMALACAAILAAICLSAAPNQAAAATQGSLTTAAATQKYVSVNKGVYLITNSSKCLDVQGGSKSSGAPTQLYTGNFTPAQRWRIESVGGGFYRIVEVESGKVLDVSGGRAANSTRVQQWDWNGTKAQKWRFAKDRFGNYTIVSALSPKLVLDVRGGSTADGAPVQIYTANGTRAQSWKLEAVTPAIANGYYTFSNGGSGKVLDVSGASLADGANIQQYVANSTMAQTFRVQFDANTGYYTIRCTASGKAVDVCGASAANGANVWQYNPNGTRAQLWHIVKAKDGTLSIRSSLNGLALAVRGGSGANGANVQMAFASSAKAQKWSARAKTNWIPNATYTVMSAKNRARVLDITGASQASGANVQLYVANGTGAQVFKIAHAGSGAYTIQNMNSGLYADAAQTKAGANVAQTKTKELWVPELEDNGIVFRLKGNTKVALEAQGGSMANGANVRVASYAGAPSQKWLLAQAAMPSAITYDNLTITLEQMVVWNWYGNPYSATYFGSMDKLRSSLNPSSYSDLEFVDLRKPTGTTAAQLDAYISTYGSNGKLAGLGKVFYDAAKKYSLNQDYLLAHAILESGWGKSELASGYRYAGGYIDGKYYPAGTYYNFFGIGAYDTSPLSGGRKLAIINGWNSPAKAVSGAAEWIARNYIHRSGTPQYTLYAMKWDYLSSNVTKSYGWHQYATGATWTNVIAKLMGEIYGRTGTGKSLTYIIPRYKQ